MLPLSRFSGFSCPSCCAKKGEPHLSNCTRPRQFDSFSLSSTGLWLADCGLSETGEQEDLLAGLSTPGDDLVMPEEPLQDGRTTGDATP